MEHRFVCSFSKECYSPVANRHSPKTLTHAMNSRWNWVDVCVLLALFDLFSHVLLFIEKPPSCLLRHFSFFSILARFIAFLVIFFFFPFFIGQNSIARTRLLLHESDKHTSVSKTLTISLIRPFIRQPFNRQFQLISTSSAAGSFHKLSCCAIELESFRLNAAQLPGSWHTRQSITAMGARLFSIR